MSAFFHRSESQIFVEFAEGGAHVACGDRSLEVANTPEAIRNAIGLVAKADAGAQIFCLLPAKGISFRKISLPARTQADVDRLLPMQIDAQFPIASDDLAWGYLETSSNGAMKELLVAALKKEALEPYRAIIAGAGFSPVFAIAALARRAQIPREIPPFAILDVKKNSSELLIAAADGTFSLRSTDASAATGISKIFTGGPAPAGLAATPLPLQSPTTAIAGLREQLRRGESPLLLSAERSAIAPLKAPSQWRWAAAAAALFILFLGLRMAEPVLRQQRAAKRLDELKAHQSKLPKMDREVSFLQFMKTNQPSYLDALAAVGSAAQGIKMEALTISRRGELSLRGQMQNPQGPTTMRAKLLDSGFFSLVTIDEQTPLPNNPQQVNFRLTALLRPENERPAAPKAAEKPAPKTPGAKPTNSVPTPAIATPNTPPPGAPPS